MGSLCKQLLGCLSLGLPGRNMPVGAPRHGMKDVASFVTNKLSALESVLSTATHFVLKKYKDHGTVLEEESVDERELFMI